MSVLNVGGLTKYYGAEFIFGDVGFQVARGDKVGLVGVNGAGKSTLLKIIAGIEHATSGGVHMARGTRIAYLAQEAHFSGTRTLWQEMEASLGYLAELQQAMSALEQELADSNAPDWDARMEQYGELMHRFEHGGGYEIEHRIDRTLHGLGFREEQYHQQVGLFSGGQKTRAALAAALLSDPDLLMLDEPTNHLDLAALEWLERFLKNWDGTLIVISHDRYFLDKVTNRTFDMAFGRLEDYPAGYNKFLELKAERMELRLKHYQAEQAFVAKTEEFVRRFKAGQRSKEARGREKRLERLKEGWEDGSGRVHKLMDRPQDMQKKVAFKLNTQARSGEVALKLDGLAVGYRPGEGRPANGNGQAHTDAQPNMLIRSLELEILRGQRVALLGPNGSGKTTLLRTIVGELPALRGQIRPGYNVTINYYAQAHEGLNHNATVLEEIRRVRPMIKETEVRTLLGRFLFSGDDVFKRVGDLSGGERSRVALAQLTLMNGNLLVLDEPTNHLDIDSREALENVLNEYQGSILFVSHDRYFIDAVADTIWMVRDSAIETFAGTYTEYAEYREQLEAHRSAVSTPRPSATEPPHTDAPPTVQNGNGAAPRGPMDKEQQKEERRRQRRLAALEQEIAELEARMQQTEEAMNAAGLQGDVDRVTRLGIEHTQMQEQLATRYDEWSAMAG